VCSEAVANVAKHAGAACIAITAGLREGRLLLEIRDNGAGGAGFRAGGGLRGLADRVEAVGGTLRRESPPGDGTRLTADLPLGGDAA
jgi:signal transduction histidine kinase